MKKIFVSGSAAYDEIMDFPHHFKNYFHPEKLHQINVSFVVTDLAKHLGGITTNISYALRNTLNFYKSHQDIFPVAAVGRDGSELMEFFKKNDIDLTYVQKDQKLYTATGKVITDKANNQIWGFYYGAAILKPKFKTLNPKPSEDFWIIAATHERPFTASLEFVIKHKLPYLFDPGMTLTWINDELLKKGVMNATYLIGNDYEIAMIENRLKMSVKEIVKKGVNVITTLGEKGVQFNSVIDSVKKISPIIMPAAKLQKVIDPTGAGDAWRGGFVGALSVGRPLVECLAMGNVMASFAVESVGTVEYLASEKEIKKRMKSIVN